MCVYAVFVLKTHSLFGGWLWVRSGVCFPGFGNWHRSCVPVSVYSGYYFGFTWVTSVHRLHCSLGIGVRVLLSLLPLSWFEVYKCVFFSAVLMWIQQLLSLLLRQLCAMASTCSQSSQTWWERETHTHTHTYTHTERKKAEEDFEIDMSKNGDRLLSVQVIWHQLSTLNKIVKCLCLKLYSHIRTVSRKHFLRLYLARRS